MLDTKRWCRKHIFYLGCFSFCSGVKFKEWEVEIPSVQNPVYPAWPLSIGQLQWTSSCSFFARGLKTISIVLLCLLFILVIHLFHSTLSLKKSSSLVFFFFYLSFWIFYFYFCLDPFSKADAKMHDRDEF